jgi:hypothetical protein
MKNNEFKISIKTVWFLVVGTMLLTIAGAFSQVQHYNFSQVIFVLALISYLTGFIIIISDMSKRNIYNKSFWIMSMILLPAIAPIVYLIRRNVLIQNRFNDNN